VLPVVSGARACVDREAVFLEFLMASVQGNQMQSRVKTLMDNWVKQSTQADSIGRGGSVSKTEANQLLKQAGELPKEGVESLKKAFVAQLNANAFTVTPDAAKLFADFFKIPADSIPLTSTKRTSVNSAQATRVANETDTRTRVGTKEMKEFLNNAQGMPKNLQGFVAAGFMRQLQQGGYKLEGDARSMLTKFIAQNGGGNSPFSMDEAFKVAGDLKNAAGQLDSVVSGTMKTATRSVMAEVVNNVTGAGGLDALSNNLSMGVQPMSYAGYVAMHGGSFEDILFAFLMQLADKVDKKLMDKIKSMEHKERVGKSDDAVKAGIDSALKADADGNPPAAGGKARKVSAQLEDLVQSVHGMVGGKSEDGAKVSKGEAERLVARLKTLPDNVQDLLAGSVAAAMKASPMNMQPEAQAALAAWGKGVRGDKFDITPTASPPPPGTPSELAAPLKNSTNLEDKLAGFLVETLTSDTASLKDKMGQFKGLKDQVDAQVGTKPNTPDNTTATKPGKPGKTDATTAPEPTRPQAGGVPEETPKSEALEQNEMQRLMQERNRIFDMLSNLMKAMHDMIMTSVRNMR
jgi:hypothetical protein